MHPDSKLPNDAQRRKLCEMLHHALVDIRNLAGAGHSQQASDLADAFHNLPHEIWCDYFSLTFFREAFLDPHYQRWPQVSFRDYRLLLSEVERLA